LEVKRMQRLVFKTCPWYGVMGGKKLNYGFVLCDNTRHKITCMS
jgi:hypothetical protein